MEFNTRSVVVLVGVVTIVLLCSVVCTSAQPQPERQYSHSYTLTNQAIIHWQWNRDVDTMSIALVCYETEEADYCGIGWNRYPSMLLADAVVGSVGAEGEVIIHDFRFGEKEAPGSDGLACPSAVCSETLPQMQNIMSCSNDVTNAIGRREDNWLVFEFERPVNASDECDLELAEEKQYVLYAVGPGQVPTGVGKHVGRGTVIQPGEILWFANDTANTDTTEPFFPTNSETDTTDSTMESDEEEDQDSSSVSEYLGFELWHLVVALALALLIVVLTVVAVVCIIKQNSEDDDSLEMGVSICSLQCAEDLF